MDIAAQVPLHHPLDRVDLKARPAYAGRGVAVSVLAPALARKVGAVPQDHAERQGQRVGDGPVAVQRAGVRDGRGPHLKHPTGAGSRPKGAG